MILIFQQGRAEVWWCPGQILVCMRPYQILVLRNVRNTATAILPSQTFATCKRIPPQVRKRKEKNCPCLVSRYATTARALNVVKFTCKATEFCMALSARQKWSTVRFRKFAGALLKNTKHVFKHIVLGAESALTAPNDILSDKFTVLFWSFLQQLQAKNLSLNRYAWCSPVTQSRVLWCPMRAVLKKICFWHFLKKRNTKNISKTKTILLSYRKHFRFANVFQTKTFSFSKIIFSFRKHLHSVYKLKYFRFKNKNNFTFVSKALSFCKCFLNKNIFV